MTFRDDREALRQKSDALEAELSAAKRELAEKDSQEERMRDLEKELAEARERLERVDAAIRGQKPPAAKNRAVIAAGAAVALAVMGGVMALTLARSPAPPPPPPKVVEPMAVPTPVPPPEPPAVIETPTAPGRELQVTWAATVRSATGIALARGAKCTIAAVLRSGKKKYDAEIACGGQVLYRSTDTLEGMSQSSQGYSESHGLEARTRRYGLRYVDQGTRSGARAQVSIETAAGSAVAWRDGATAYRVELDVDDMGAPVDPAAPPLDPASSWDKLAFDEPVRRTGRATSVSGAAPIKAGAACEAVLVPEWGQYNCRLRVKCGATFVYGAPGYGFSKCDVGPDRKPTAFHDTTLEGDPKVELDFGKKSLQVDGRTPDGKDWSVTISL